MSRRRKEETHINHERWMVSFADFMTLLFALFVVLFAISSVDQAKYRKVADSFQQAFGTVPNQGQGLMETNPGVPGPVNVIPPVMPHHAPMPPLQKQIEDALKQNQSLKNAAKVRAEARGVVIQLQDQVLFASGSAQLMPQAEKPLLQLLRSALTDPASQVRIEGHTDNQALRPGGLYRSNWDLSSARAMNVLQLLLAHKLVSPQRLAVAGYGEYHPIASNATAAGRAQNRRVDIVILSPQALRDEPVAEPQTTEAKDGLNRELSTQLQIHRR